ncbi:TolB family protein [Ornithinibacillus halophilus]|uniref:Uncharacterized protein n=1 Tax=Ornithinibacillus halophilus TaxID=930117 RepID=A0A1M5EFB7_9BACI|nr:hypothetical protein [Ornithinibacillus halophilus]SHF77919.1 hypothetical protein SAMN05216225_10051 [Ornithinibacillus halophilus]
MTKDYPKNRRDHEFKKLSHAISWNSNKKEQLHQRINDSIDRLESKKDKSIRFSPYVASIGLFLVFIAVGYTLYFNGDQQNIQGPEEPPVVIEPTPDDDETDELGDNEAQEKTLHHYDGTYDDSHYSVAMTDERSDYIIEASIQGFNQARIGVNKEKLAKITYDADSLLNEYLLSEYGLQVVFNEFPIGDFEVVDNHLNLQFEQQDVMGLTLHSGVDRAFSLANRIFASNFINEAFHYTVYSGDEPFYNEHEGFGIIDMPINTPRFYVPVTIDDKIYLGFSAYGDNVFEDKNQLFEAYFANHQDSIDFSMFTVDYIEINARNDYEISIEGDLGKAAKANQMIERDIRELLIHGLGLNILHQKELFPNVHELFVIINGNSIDSVPLELSSITPNVLPYDFFAEWEPEEEFDVGQLSVKNSTYETISEVLDSVEVSSNWSRNKEVVAFSSIGDSDPQSYMYLWKVGEKRPMIVEDVFGYISHYKWSPNSQYVIAEMHTSAFGRTGILYSMKDGSISEFQYDYSLAWSPDSTKIAIGLVDENVEPVVQTEMGGTMHLAEYDLDTGNVTVLEEGTQHYYLYPSAWEDDGTIIYEKRDIENPVKLEVLEWNE